MVQRNHFGSKSKPGLDIYSEALSRLSSGSIYRYRNRRYKNKYFIYSDFSDKNNSISNKNRRLKHVCLSFWIY